MITPYKAARAAWHMTKFQAHLKNGAEFWLRHRFERLRPMPPLRFWNGQVWHHGEHDSPFDLFSEIYMGHFYEPLTDAPKNAIVLDIGANIGAVTMFWAKDRPDLAYHCYEPNPQSYKTLLTNIAKNNLWQVKAYNEAISNSREPIGLWIDVPTILSSSYDHAPGYNGKTIAELGGRLIDVPAITLDDAWQRLGCPAIWMLKIDVEGAEGDILEATSDGMLAAVETACIEWHDNIVHGVRERCLSRLNRSAFTWTERIHPWNEGIIFASR